MNDEKLLEALQCCINNTCEKCPLKVYKPQDNGNDIASKLNQNACVHTLLLCVHTSLNYHMADADKFRQIKSLLK